MLKNAPQTEVAMKYGCEICIRSPPASLFALMQTGEDGIVLNSTFRPSSIYCLIFAVSMASFIQAAMHILTPLSEMFQ